MLVFLGCLAVAWPLLTHAQDGTLDPGFAPVLGTNDPQNNFPSIGYLLRQPDGKVIIEGNFDLVDGVARPGLARVNADGSLDASFDPGTGLTTTSNYGGGHGAGAYDLVLQPDGKLVMVGFFQYYHGVPCAYTVRANADGSFDSTFDGPGTGYPPESLAVQPDGKLILLGDYTRLGGVPREGLARLNADGSTDLSFQTDSGLSFEGGDSQVTVQADGKILLSAYIGGADGPLPPLRRLNPDGSTDPSFVPAFVKFNRFAVQDDGKIVVAGRLDPNDPGPFSDGYYSGATVVARLLPDGSRDRTFLPYFYAGDVTRMIIQPDGKPIVVGSALRSVPPRDTYRGIFRLNADGSPDDHFANDLSLRGKDGFAGTVALQPDGKVLVGGTFDAVNGVPQASLARLHNGAPAITSAAAATAQAGSAFAYQITATFQPTGYAASGLPTGLSLDAVTGLISGVPVATGTFNIALTATNAAGPGTATLALTVVAPPMVAPVITSALGAVGRAGQAFSYQIAATNGPTSYAATGLPAGLIVDAESGLISGVPAGGTFSIGLSATNAYGTGLATLTLTIRFNPMVPAPALTSSPGATGQVGQPFAYQITASNAPASYAAIGLPSGLSVDTASGLITGTPTAAGNFPITLQATNAGGIGTAALTLTVIPALPVVSLVATTPLVTAGSGTSGLFTLSLSAAQDHDVIVSFTIKGTAANGTDYVLLKATKKIKAGKTSKPIKIIPLGVGAGTGVKRTVVLTLQPGPGYTVATSGKVKIKILDQ